MDLNQHTSAQLKLCLQALKEKTGGSKAELITRIQKYDADVVKNILDKILKEQVNERSLLDISTTMDTVEDPVQKLQTQVATLTTTVDMLVKNLQSVLLNAQTAVPSPLPVVNACNTADIVSAVAMPSPLPLTGTNTITNNVQSIVAAPSSLPVNNVDRVANVMRNPTNAAVPSPLPLAATNVGNVARNVDHATQFTMHDNVDSNFSYGNNNFNNFPNTQHSMLEQQTTMLSGLITNAHEVVRVIPEFRPGIGMSSSMFVSRINQLRRAYGWNEQVVLYAMYDKLKGAAHNWIHSMPIFHCWPEFERAFMEDFSSDIDTAQINMKMMRMCMEKGESYVDYYYKMLALGRQGNMSDAAIITYIKNGIHDDNVKQVLVAMKFDRCSELLKSLTNMTVNSKKREVFNNVYHSQAPLAPKVLASKPNVLSVKPYSPICYRCRERGHLARNCTKLHKPATRVNSGNAVNNIEPETEANPINTIVDNIQYGELCRHITILSKPALSCVALMDSGSCKSLIKMSIADNCGINKVNCMEKLTGFAGGFIYCKSKIQTNIQFDDAVYPGDLLVVDDNDMKYDVIIGTDILCKGVVIIHNGVCHVMTVDATQVGAEEKLPENVGARLEKMLNENACCFGEKLDELGKSKSFKIDINLTSSRPIARKPYQIPIPKQHIVEEIVQQLLDLGIIKHSRSNYSSPIVLVKKSNGENRLCVDFREINTITEKQPWHMPTVDGVLATLHGKQFFTTLDMMSGYYQIEVDESIRKYTAFVTHNGHFEFCRMPFGLRNAPCAFQRMMTELIAPVKKSVVCYVDEVIIATKTADDNITILEQFLKLVKDEGLTLRLSKCTLLKQSITFLGHKVDKNGVIPGEVKTLAIKNYPLPRSQMDVRRFMGLASFFRKFVPQFAIIAKPLNNLLKKDTKFEWNETCQRAFESLIGKLVQPPILAIYDVEKEHQLHTDASSCGVAAILLQFDETNWKPLAYYSRACTAAESKYHAMNERRDKATQNILKAREKWKHRFDAKHSKPTPYKESDLILVESQKLMKTLRKTMKMMIT